MTSRLFAARLTFVFLCTAMAGGGASAGDVYKCTSPQGDIAFQDQHCASGDTETQISIAAPPPVSPPAPGDDDVPPAEPTVATSKPVAGSLPGTALRPLWVCTRPDDGTQYMSKDGISQPRMVPAGILGLPGQSLASAYGGRNGIGVSAPGLRKIPVDASPQAALAGAYVAIQDQCDRATAEQTCDYLHSQRDQVHEKLKRAFKAEQAVLQPQQDELDEQLGGC
jgi:hypothetical protein